MHTIYIYIYEPRCCDRQKRGWVLRPPTGGKSASVWRGAAKRVLCLCYGAGECPGSGTCAMCIGCVVR